MADPGQARTDTTGVRVPPPLFYVAAFLAGLLLEAVIPVDGPTAAVRIAAAVAGGVGWLALDGAAMYSFVTEKTNIPPTKPSTTLVTTGPYRFTRNPMYLGMALLYVGLAVALGVIWALATLPLAVIAIDRLVIAREEPYLERTFGQPYRDYRARVRRWI